MGGCVSSNGDVNDRHPNMFHVWNVDELGNVFIPGRIEVTDSELVLYQKGKEPIRWPMRCLRRYGFDAELFSFESGRRCATGTGIYAFKCQRAEALFNLLQEQIQSSGQDGNNQVDSGTGGAASIGASNNINSHSSVGNGIVVATAAAANGSILRSGSLSVSTDISGNYLEPIVRYRTRSINNNNNNNHSHSHNHNGHGHNNNNGTVGIGASSLTASRDCFSRLATQSLPSNISFMDNGAATSSPHYVNDDIVVKGDAVYEGDTVSIRSPPCLPSLLPAFHEYANATIMMTDETKASTSSTTTAAAAAAPTRPKSLQECHQLSTASASETSTSTTAPPPTMTTTTATMVVTEDVSAELVLPVTASGSIAKTICSIVDLPKNALPASTGIVRMSNGCRQVVLRGHSLDETTNYARLDDLLKQEHSSAQRHLYMNVVPDSVQKACVISKDGTFVVQSVNANGQSVQSSQKHHHRHHNHHHSNHQHVASSGFYGRQKSLESPLMSGSSSASSACGIPITATSTTSTTVVPAAAAPAAKDSVLSNNNNNNNSHNYHHHHHHHKNHHQHSNSISYHPSQSSTTTTSTTIAANGAPALSRQVNYAVLDLNHRGSNGSGGSTGMTTANGECGGHSSSGGSVTTSRSDAVPTSPVSLAMPTEPLQHPHEHQQQQQQQQLLLLSPPVNCRTALEGYATIDFDRTVALSNVSAAHPCLENDESVRKTRHNSTINDLFLSKHSSIVSE